MLKRDRCCLSLAGPLLTALAVFGAHAACAKVMILSSDVETLKVNTDLADGESLKIPAGKRVQIMLPSGTTAVVNGPADVPVRELEKGHTLLKPLWNRVKSYLSQQESSEAARPKDTGAPGARSKGQLASSALLSWSLVPIPANGEGAVCVLKGAPLSFERRSLSPLPTADQKKAMMRLSPGEALGRKPVVIRWKSTAARAPWPQEVAVSDGGRYYAEPNFTGPSQIALKLVDKASMAGNQVLPVLYSKGCFEQIKAWVIASSRRP